MSPELASRAILLFGVLMVIAGCGSRTDLYPLRLGVDGGGLARDAGPRTDGGARDAGRDTGPLRVDAGPSRRIAHPAARACRNDQACADLATECILDPAIVPDDLANAPLLCGAASDATPVSGECRNADDCGRGLCVVAGTCVMPCDEDADCSARERCQRVFVRTARAALQRVEACVRRVDLPRGVAVTTRREVREGGLIGGDGDNVLELDGVDAPHSMIVLGEFGDSSPYVRSARARGVAGTVLFDELEAYAGGDSGINPLYGFGVEIMLYVPNGPRSRPFPGGYELGYTATDAGDVTIDTLSWGEAGNVLDIDIYYVGGGDWTPEGERGPISLRRALERAEAIFEEAGVRFGRVRQLEVVGGLRERLEFVEDRGGDTDLNLLFSLSAGSNRAAINYFMIRGSDSFLGSAGGIPGPMAMNGRASSGIAIAVDLHRGSNDLVNTLVHEGGHYLGLFHTSEINGIVLEPLPDTAECRIARDRNGDMYLTPDECVGAGADNLMFWAPEGDNLSEHQIDVIRGALLLNGS